MKVRNLFAGSALALAAAFGLSTAASATVSLTGLSVTLYSGFIETPNLGIKFSDPFGTDSISAIHELASYGGVNDDPNWPDGHVLFGADFTGSIDVTTAGTYKFAFASDDASYILINGALVADEVGPNSLPGLKTFAVPLTAGANTLEIQYDNDECCQTAIEFQAVGVPEPATWAVMLLGFGGMGVVMRSRRQRVAAV